MTHMGGVAVEVIRAALRPLAQRVWGGVALHCNCTHMSSSKCSGLVPPVALVARYSAQEFPQITVLKHGFSNLYLMSSLSIES